jgi:ribosome-binding factor A
MAVDRMRRVNELLQRHISRLLPLIYPNTAHLVTVAAVDTSRDLKNSTIHLSILAETPMEEAAIFEEICELRGVVQRELAALLTFKSTPHIRFKHDHSAERGVGLVNLLDSLEVPPDDAL